MSDGLSSLNLEGLVQQSQHMRVTQDGCVHPAIRIGVSGPKDEGRSADRDDSDGSASEEDPATTDERTSGLERAAREAPVRPGFGKKQNLSSNITFDERIMFFQFFVTSINRRT